MKELELLLKALTAANLATPAIVALIQSVKGSVQAGLSDDEILADAASVAQETKALTEKDMLNEP